ncbi:hypothetical protein AT268_02780 [Bacillus cereus]|uniref:Uncharacterized protein n=2 Tax=Bacillaceae TaxID=186817 RepID=A0A9X0MCF8_BACCE|nr:hypothetical protein AT268_02780 [Bacillus cereus]
MEECIMNTYAFNMRSLGKSMEKSLIGKYLENIDRIEKLSTSYINDVYLLTNFHNKIKKSLLFK